MAIDHTEISAPDRDLEQQQHLAGVKWNEVENCVMELKVIHFVPSKRIEQLMAEAGFTVFTVSFRILVRRLNSVPKL